LVGCQPAAGQPDDARARLDAALRFTADTGVHFYDAELLRRGLVLTLNPVRALRA
jgi:hypothetical protein